MVKIQEATRTIPTWICNSAIALVYNPIFSIALMANGCGNYFAQGVSYADGQECDSWLLQQFGVRYFSNASPLPFFDIIGLFIILNWMVFWILKKYNSGKNLPKKLFIVFAFIGLALPIAASIYFHRGD